MSSSKKAKKTAPNKVTKSRVATRAKTTEERDVIRESRSSRAVHGAKVFFVRQNTRRKNYLARRPHRTLHMTRRRDYRRSLKLPGFFSFTLEVSRVLWRQKRTFLPLGIVFFALVIAFGLLGSESIYGDMRSLLNQTAPTDIFSGAAGEVGKAGIVLLTATTTGLTGELDTSQRIIAGFLSLYVWLVVVWLLRNMLANKKVKLRDGLYSAGSPILSTFMMFVIILIQLVPMAIAVIVASAAWQTVISGGVESMAAALGLLLVSALSLYWVTSTFFALVIVTLPGMYPFRALAVAGDLVVGRRLRLLYRILWLFVTILSWWVVVTIPFILLDNWLKSTFEQISWVPVVPVVILGLTTFTIIWSAAYIYLLYRKVVDDDASPA